MTRTFPPGLDAPAIPHQGALVVVQVLEYVERADHVELLVGLQVLRIPLRERRGRDELPGDLERFGAEIGAHELDLGRPVADRLQHEPGSTSDVQEARCIVTVRVQRPDDELVPATEPEVIAHEAGRCLVAHGKDADRA